MPQAPKPAIDVSTLPNVVFEYRSAIWWATIGLVAIEGFMFGVIIAAYFYLRTRVNDWPPGVDPPKLLWGTLNLALIVISVIPNMWIKRRAHKLDVKAMRIGLVGMSLIAIIGLALRAMEFTALNCRWDANAYASILWTILGLHTTHLITDAYDTWVLAALFFTDRIEGRRFVDASENADYWNFVVVTWVIIYAVIYFAPRIL